MLKNCSVGQEVQQTRANYEGKKRHGVVVEIDARKLRARVRWLGLGKNLRTWVSYKYLRGFPAPPGAYKPEL